MGCCEQCGWGKGENSAVKHHPEISRSKEPWSLPGLKGKGKEIFRAHWDLESWRQWPDKMLPAGGKERCRDRAEKPPCKQAWVSIPSRRQLAVQEHGQFAPGSGTGRGRQRKEPEEGKCRISGTMTMPNTPALIRCFVWMWVHSGYCSNPFFFPSFSCNRQILSDVTRGQWSPWSKC